ncbi:MAG: hypothetical protein ACREQ9_05150 [Candidatus Binatia bacterium]
MPAEKSITERVLNVLKPYASNWSGTLGRGDLVIPQHDIPRLVHDILDSVREIATPQGEASDRDVFEALADSRKAACLQDQVAELRKRFVILPK